MLCEFLLYHSKFKIFRSPGVSCKYGRQQSTIKSYGHKLRVKPHFVFSLKQVFDCY